MLPLVHSSQTAASRAEARQDAHGAYSHPSAVPRSAVCVTRLLRRGRGMIMKETSVIVNA